MNRYGQIRLPAHSYRPRRPEQGAIRDFVHREVTYSPVERSASAQSRPWRADQDPVEVEPVGHLLQFDCEGFGQVGGSRLWGDGGDQQGGGSAVGFEVDSGDEAVAEEEGEDVVAVGPLGCRGVDADSVEEVEEAMGAIAVPDQGVEG